MPAAPKFVRNAPVTSLSTIESLVAFALTFLVTHGVIGNVDVGTTTQAIAPFVSLALPAVFGAAQWALVSPYEKVRKRSEEDGVFSDADFGRVESLVQTQLARYLGRAEGEDEQDIDPEDYDELDELGRRPATRRLALLTTDLSAEVPPRGMAAGGEELSGPHSVGR